MSVFSYYQKITALMRDPEKLRFLLIGGVNTGFGYFYSIWFFYFFQESLSVFTILMLNTWVTITFSFITYKFFVFKSSGLWIYEYLRAFTVYGVSGIFSFCIIWVLVAAFGLEYWLVQLVALCVTVIISYYGHRNFTFKVSDK